MKSSRTIALLAALVLGIVGCGLGDYEKRIDEQRKRLEFLDEENRFLAGDSIEAPLDASKQPYWPFEVFLRLPVEMSSSLKALYSSNSQEIRLFRYGSREGYNGFVAAGLIAPEKDSSKKDDKTGKKDDSRKDEKPKAGEWSIDVFRGGVREAFLDFYHKEFKVAPEFPLFDRSLFKKTRRQPVSERGESLPAIEYEAISLTDGFNPAVKTSMFQVYFYQQTGRQVAIILQGPLAQANDESSVKAVDWCLKSLEVAGNAAMKRSALQARRQR